MQLHNCFISWTQAIAELLPGEVVAQILDQPGQDGPTVLSPGGRRAPFTWNRNGCPWRPTLSTDPPEADAQPIEDAIGAGAVGNPGPSAAEPMGVHTLGISGSSISQSSWEIWKTPVVGLVLFAGPARFGRGGLGSCAWVMDPVQAQP